MKNFNIGDKVYLKDTRASKGCTFGYFQHMNYIGGNIIYYIETSDNSIIAVNESDIVMDSAIYDLDKRITEIENMFSTTKHEIDNSPYNTTIALLKNTESISNKDIDIKQQKFPADNFISSDFKKAIDSYGNVYSVGDKVYLSDNHSDCYEIENFSIDTESDKIKAFTEKGFGYIDSIVKTEDIYKKVNDDENIYMPHMDMKYSDDKQKIDMTYESIINNDLDTKTYIIVDGVRYEGNLYLQVDKNNMEHYTLKDDDGNEIVRSKLFNHFSTSYYSAEIKFGKDGLSSDDENIEVLNGNKLYVEDNTEYTDNEFNVGDIVWVNYNGTKVIGTIIKPFDDYGKCIVELKNVLLGYNVYYSIFKTSLNHWYELNFKLFYDDTGEFPYYDNNIDRHYKLKSNKLGHKLENRIYIYKKGH